MTAANAQANDVFLLAQQGHGRDNEHEETIMDVEEPGLTDGENNREDDTEAVRETAVNVRGVDHLSTEDVKRFATAYFEAIPTIEWVDDTSCNLVYDVPENAKKALQLLSLPSGEEEMHVDVLRIAQPFPGNEDISLKLRMARMSDVKVRGARDRSKYYLFYGDPREEHEQDRRRPRKGTRRRSVSLQRKRPQRRSVSPRRNRTRSPIPLMRDREYDLFPDRVGQKSTALSGDRSTPPARPVTFRYSPGRMVSRSEDRLDDLFPEKLQRRAGTPNT